MTLAVTQVAHLNQATAVADSSAKRWMSSGRASFPALFVVSATSDSTVVSRAALMPEEAFPELPPRYGCLGTAANG